MTGRRLVVHTAGPEETRAVGRALARGLPDAFVLSLEGPLGSGKTVLAAGLCEALGVEGPVTSPTYTLQNEYVGRGGRRVIHVDCFRLGGPGEFEDLGVFDRVGEDTVLIVEWGERALAALPRETLRVELVPEGETGRRIEIRIPGGVEIGELEAAEEP